MRFLAIAAVGVVIILLAIMASGVTDAAEDFRTDQLEESFNGNTATGVTSANIQLSSALWNHNVVNASVSTNNTNDAPYLSTYNATSRQVTVNGLSANATRTITVAYMSAGLADYAGADDLALNIPIIILVFLFLIAGSAAIGVIVLAVKGRS